jgi:cytochrome c-type biogenesis protein
VTEPTLAIAVVTGLASFLSPCVLPVIPAFLAQLAGTSLGISDLERRDVFLGAVLFVAGFSVALALLGVVLNAVLREPAVEVLSWISCVAGTVIIVLALHLSGHLRLSILDRRLSHCPSAKLRDRRSGEWPRVRRRS